MVEIRKYEEKDLESVRFACLNSEGDPPDKEMCEFVLHIFCDYYIENEPQNCFVLSSDGKAVGYVICAENFGKFYEIYKNKYVPQIMHMDEGMVKWANEAYLLQEKLQKDYPAHLHIDILPEFQRSGWGGKLIKTLCDHLKAKGVKGVMLTTGEGNETANNFYKKRGFTHLTTEDTDVAYGISLV